MLRVLIILHIPTVVQVKKIQKMEPIQGSPFLKSSLDLSSYYVPWVSTVSAYHRKKKRRK